MRFIHNQSLVSDRRLRERQAEEEPHESLVRRVSEFVKEKIVNASEANVAVVAQWGFSEYDT